MPKKHTMRYLWVIVAIVGLVGCGKKDPAESRISLGKTLYFDTRLSSTNEISCNSCHDVLTTGTDNKPVSVGVNNQNGTRNAPTVFDAAHLSAQFWDGRAATLEEQAKGPLINPIEMGMVDHDAVVAVVKGIEGYKKMFQDAFPEDQDPITIDNIARSIADYERTLVTLNSPFDAYKNGDESAISDAAKRGYKTFQSVGCTACHSGDHFSGPALPQGQAFMMKFPLFPSRYDSQYDLLADGGKFETTQKELDKHLWKVPSLRNVAVTAPYFHNGKVDDLGEAVRVMAKSQLNKMLMDDDVNDIVAFLKTLTGAVPEQTTPHLPE